MIDSKIIFLHIPKTGGITFDSILFDRYPIKKRFLVSAGHTIPANLQYDTAKKIIENLDKLIYNNVNLLYGHMPFCRAKHIIDNFKFITFLRNPIDRVISDYNYILSAPSNPLHLIVSQMSITDYVSRNKDLHLDNLQTRLISGNIHGVITDNDFDIAISNIRNHFSFVGFTEYFDYSLILLKKNLGWEKLPSYTKRNVNTRKKSVQKADIDIIEENNYYDIKLYDSLLINFLDKIKADTEYYNSEIANIKNIDMPKKKNVKKIIKSAFNNLGYEIIKKKQSASKENRTQNISLNEKLTYHQTKTGNYFLPNNAPNDVIANAIKDNKIFEKEVVELAYKFIKQDTSVLDIGSNFGQMAILFAKKVGQQGRIYAFDADDYIFKILEKNIKANDLEKIIRPTFGAVHDKDGETLIFPKQDFIEFQTYGSYGIDYNASEGREVPSLTIDSLKINDRISFMKVDIQGGDLQAMKGAINTIQRNKMPILFEYEYHFEDRFNMKFQDYVDFVADIGYKFEKVVNGHNYLIIPK